MNNPAVTLGGAIHMSQNMTELKLNTVISFLFIAVLKTSGCFEYHYFGFFDFFFL